MHGIEVLLAPAERTDDLDGCTHRGERVELEDLDLVEVLDTLVGELVEQGLEYGARLVEALLRRTPAIRLATEADRPARLHPRGAAWIEIGEQRVGTLGPVHPEVLAAFDLDDAAIVVEVDLVALQACDPQPLRFAPFARFPASTRDLSVVVADAVPAGDVELAVREAAGALAERVALFDRFVGGNVPARHASLALHVVYRAADLTLTDAEVDQRHALVVTEVQRRFGAQLRT